MSENQNGLDDTIGIYNNAFNKIITNVTNYLDRSDKYKNPYLGKNIEIDGHYGYVTQKGVFKSYENADSMRNIIKNNETCPKNEPVRVNGKTKWNDIYKIPGNKIKIKSGLVLTTGTPMNNSELCGYEGDDVYVNRLQDVSKEPEYLGCFNSTYTGPTRFLDGRPNDEGSGKNHSYESCRIRAIEDNSRFFGIHDYDSDSKKGYCAVTNHKNHVGILGPQKEYEEQVIWQSNTYDAGSHAVLSDTGSLTVVNPKGEVTFSTKNRNSEPFNYNGCYKNNPDTFETHNAETYEECKQLAIDKNMSHFGLHSSDYSDKQFKNGKCLLSNDINEVRKNGKLSSCSRNSDGLFIGRGNGVSIYNTNYDKAKYFLIVHEGYMSIFKGSDRWKDFQRQIFRFMDRSVTADKNKSYMAYKSVFGRNHIYNGTKILSGQHVSSTWGRSALIMRPDGNLVLVSFKHIGNNCKQINNKFVGGKKSNAMYDIGLKGRRDIGKVANVTEDGKLSKYNNSQVQYSKSFTKHENVDSEGNNLSNTIYNNKTSMECQNICKNDKNCGGVSYDKTMKQCVLKGSSTYPLARLQYLEDNIFYSKNKSKKEGLKNIGADHYQKHRKVGSSDKKNYFLNGILNEEHYKVLENENIKLNEYAFLLDGDNTDIKGQLSQTNQEILNNTILHELNNDNLAYTKEQIEELESKIANNIGIEEDSMVNLKMKYYNLGLWISISILTILIARKIMRK